MEGAAPVDYFFNDGHHDHDAVLRYFKTSHPHLSEHAVIVFDDISWSRGMRQAWREIRDDARVTASVDLRAIGIALTGDDAAGGARIRIPL